MDYEGKRETASDLSLGESALNRSTSDITGMAQASASAGNAVLIPDANNTVVLPEGASLDDISVRGRDLVIVLEDGRTFIIPDGAVFVPQIVAQGVVVPPLNLAALLVGSEPEPAAGPVRSSGGNFELPVDPLQDAFDLGNLLPYTELAFPEAKDRQLFPIIDRKPLTGPNADVRLDDDALAGGNAGGTGDDPDGVNLTGTLSGSGGDGVLTWALSTAGAPAGFSYVANGTGINVFQGATLVLQVTLNTATGAYTVTQLAPIQHAAGGNENNQVFTLNYTVTDADGDSAPGTINIDLDDDTPLAANDTDALLAGAMGPATGNVLTDAEADGGADSLGADGGAVTAITGSGGAGTVGGSTVGTHGTLTINADGSYSYTRTGSGPINATDVFTYTVTDGDGDTATAALTITLQDAAPLTTANAAVQLDDDALAGGNAGGTGDDPDGVNLTGTLSGAGGDGALTWTAFAYVPTLGMTASLINPGLIHVFQGATHVLTITLDNATGAYTVTQLAPIDHAALGDENNASFTLHYNVTDADGDVAGGSLVIDLDDDTPLAANDTDALLAGAMGPATGNVLTDAEADGGADSLGADGGAVTAITGSGGAGTVGGSTVGTHGTLTINADGSYSYTRTGSGPINATDVFTYTVTDGDGDTATAALTITLQDAAPLTAANAAVQLDDDALAGGNAGGTGDDPDGVNLTGTLSGAGGDGALTWALATTGAPAGFSYVANGTGVDVFEGTTLVMQVTLNQATGAYTVSQVAPIIHDAGADENNTAFTFSYTVTDQDGDSASGTLNVDVDDDTPVAVSDIDSLPSGSMGPATGNVITDAEADGGADLAGADSGLTVTAISGAAAGTVGGTTNGVYGTLTINADGSYSYTRNAGTPGDVSDVFTYTVTDADGDTATATLTIAIANATPVVAANATVLLDDDALTGGIAGGAGDDPDAANTSGTLSGSGGDGALTWAFQLTGNPSGFSYVANGTGVDVFQGAAKVLQVTLNAATGAYSVTQVAPIDHAIAGTEDNQAFSLSYTVTDSDGDGAGGTLAIDVDDDGPVAVVPTAISLTNAAGAPVLASLDPNLLDNYGADGGTVRFSPTLNGTNSGLTSSLTPILYTVSPDGLSLIGKAGATTIFTITLLPGSNMYSVDMDGTVDSLTTIDFASGAYQFVGGNTGWVGLVPVGQDTTSSTVDDNSKDLLITPQLNGVNGGTVNGSTVALGVGSGNAVGANEMIRIDFVVDLAGDTAGPGGYGTAGNRDHLFDGHYTTNGASALLTASAGSVVKVTTRDDPDGNNAVGDGTIDPITKIVIAYNGVASGFIIPTTTPTDYLVNGITYTVTLNADGTVNVGGVEGTSGAGAIGTQIAAFTANGYNSLEFAHVSGDTFKLGNFGAVVQSTNPVNFAVPVEVIDGDGDVSTSANLAITLTAPVAPPVVMDLDGDGVEFLSAAAGVAFDYDGDGLAEGTAWVGADDGLLAIDLNGDGLVNDGSEIVFGGAGQTDLEGLAASYDSNGDGLLSAADAAFARFGVWQDANSDGITQEGELQSLAELGITTIELTSDGIAYSAADGDVQVAGEASYTLTDGSTGTLADASFALTGERQAIRSAELVAASSAATGLLAAMAIEHASAAADEGLARAGLAAGGHDREALLGALPEQALAAAKAPVAEAQNLPEKATLETSHALNQSETGATRGLDQLGDHFADLRSDSGNDEAKSALFDGYHGVQAMEALLAQGPAPAAKADGAAHPALAAALADNTGAETVDSIVDYFAPNSAGATQYASRADGFDLEALLNLNINGEGDGAMPHFAMMPELDHDQALMST